jgi:RNA polymerase sigma-70 factor (ECF subfamily)
MPEVQTTTVRIQGCIDRLKGGDVKARGELIGLACERLERLTRKMLRDYPRVHRWEDTGDVLQNAAMRLFRSLDQVTPQTVPDFFRLASLNIRRELLDLVKHYYGPRGHGAKHATFAGREASDSSARELDKSDLSGEAGRLALWTEFHELVEALPQEEREVVDLLWYQGLTQDEAAVILKVSDRTVKRRWQAARLKLHDALQGGLPGN